ncbi:MSHA pilin protein MshC [Vibrio crassostreae]|nr:MSHA pilin protein MshC [Vibrio crassostreae]CAK3116032.1 MSHA pilin protein MshC [Vibrio crassostreae]
MDNRPISTGFTLVELIIVIIIVAILSSYAASRYIGTSSFSAVAAQEQVISIIRQIQVNRMQSNVSGHDGHFRLQVSPDCLGSSESCGLSAAQREHRSDWIADASLTFSQTGSTSLIDFDLLGNPLNVSGADITISIRENANQSQCLVSINPQGYVSKGSCS